MNLNERSCRVALGWAVLGCAALSPLAHAQSSAAKKELAAKAVQLQMADIESTAVRLVEQPAMLMLQDAGQALQQRVPAEQREAIGKRIQDSARKYVDEATPLLRERALKLAPTMLAASFEEKFTEEELKQLVAWLESPVSRKYQQAVPAIQGAFVQKLVTEARPVIDPKLQALEQSIRSALGAPPATPDKAAKPKPGASAPKPAGK